MAVETTCSGCGKKLAVGEEHAGKRARCPACGQIYTVPFPGQPSDSLSPQPSDLAIPTLTSSDSAGNYPNGNAGGGVDSSAGQLEQLWMRASDGNMYGPVDRPTMERWFREGRVGVGYQIRIGEYGSWLTPDAFRAASPIASASNYSAASQSPSNPYAQTNPYVPSGQVATSYPKADQSVLIIIFAIIGFVLCPIFSLIAWIMAGSALKDIQAGHVDPSNKGVIQAGYYLGMLNCILTLLCVCGYFVIVALAVVGGAVN